LVPTEHPKNFSFPENTFRTLALETLCSVTKPHSWRRWLYFISRFHGSGFKKEIL